MPRPQRVHMPGGVYHVSMRGNHRQPIFRDDFDRREIGRIVGDTVKRHGLRVFAYCWMPNHIHLALQIAEAPLLAPMRELASHYARYYQRNVPTTGHFFERRYRAKLVDETRYLLELVRYIHLNPVRAALARDPSEHVWSGHREYLGAAPAVGWLDCDTVLGLLAPTAGEARFVYARHVTDGIGLAPDPALRFGRDSARVLQPRPPRPRPARPAHPPPAVALDAIIAQVCERFGLTLETLGEYRGPAVAARARAVIAHHALAFKAATIAELARRFARAESTVIESLQYHRRVAPECFGAL